MVTAKKAFVLMPFAPQYTPYYLRIFKPALEEALYEVSRADDLFTPGFIIADVQKSILEAHLILCDMSERNPNVFYELGLAHAIGKPVILVAQKEEDIPFDLRHLRAFIYNTTNSQWEESLSQTITQAAISIDDSYKVFPPPLIKTENIKDSRDILPSYVKVNILKGQSTVVFDGDLFIRYERNPSAYSIDPERILIGSPGYENKSLTFSSAGEFIIYKSSSKYEIRILSRRSHIFSNPYVELIITRLRE